MQLVETAPSLFAMEMRRAPLAWSHDAIEDATRTIGDVTVQTAYLSAKEWTDLGQWLDEAHGRGQWPGYYNRSQIFYRDVCFQIMPNWPEGRLAVAGRNDADLSL